MYVTDEDARKRLASQVTVGLTGVARIVREYADAGIQFDERRILNVVDSLQAIVEEQRVVDAEPSLTVGDGHDLVDDSDPAYIASDSL